MKQWHVDCQALASAFRLNLGGLVLIHTD